MTGCLVVPLWEPTPSIFFTTSIPSVTEPKTTCLPSNQAVLTVQRKNWEPLVPGPALAMERTPAPKVDLEQAVSGGCGSVGSVVKERARVGE